MNVMSPLWSTLLRVGSLNLLLLCMVWRMIDSNCTFWKKIYLFLHMSLSSDTQEEDIWSHYRWLWGTMWLLGIELRTSAHSSPACSAPKIHSLFYVSTLQLSSDTPEEGIRSHYRWLWDTMWLLGFELRTSGRAASALNHWAISPALFVFVCFVLF